MEQLPQESVEPFFLVAAWLKFLDVSETANENTRAQYRRTLTSFWADMGELGVRPMAVSEDDVVGHLQGRTVSNRARILRATKSFYGFALYRGEIEKDPTVRLAIPRVRNRRAKYFSKEQVRDIVLAADKIDPRAGPAILLCFSTGARLASICGMTTEGLSGDELEFDVVKGDKDHVAMLNAEALASIERLVRLKDYSPQKGGRRLPTLLGVGRQTFSKWLKDSAAAAGVRGKATPHMLRHTYGHEMAMAGVDLRTWCESMGHSDASQFMRYSHVDPARMREAASVVTLGLESYAVPPGADDEREAI